MTDNIKEGQLITKVTESQLKDFQEKEFNQ
jgi:hypothetical protein